MANVARTGRPYVAGIAKQSAAGVYPSSGPTTFLKYVKCNVKENLDEKKIQTHDGTRSGGFVSRDQAKPSGSINMPAWPENGLEPFLGYALGTWTKTGSASPYTHTITPATTLPYFTLWQWPKGISEAPDVHMDCLMNTLEFQANGPGVLDMTAELVCNPLDLSKTAPTATYSPADPFIFNQAVLTLDGTALPFSKWSLKINNNIGDGLPLADGSLYNSFRAPDSLDITGHLEYPFQNQDALKNWLGGSTSATTLTSTIIDHTLGIEFTGKDITTGNPYSLSFDLARVILKEPDIDKDSNDPLVYAQDFEAMPASDGDFITATVVNALASANI